MSRTSLKSGLVDFFKEIGENDEVSKKAYRAAQVHNLYKAAIEHVYGDSAFLVLEKTNAVYIMVEKDKGIRRYSKKSDKTIKRMAIYTCDSMVHADLDSKQEFIKIWLAEQGEVIDKFDLLTSKLGMRKNFPYAEDVNKMKESLSSKYTFLQEKKEKVLSDEEMKQVFAKIDTIDNENLKKALKDLIEAS